MSFELQDGDVETDVPAEDGCFCFVAVSKLYGDGIGTAEGVIRECYEVFTNNQSAHNAVSGGFDRDDGSRRFCNEVDESVGVFIQGGCYGTHDLSLEESASGRISQLGRNQRGEGSAIAEGS